MRNYLLTIRLPIEGIDDVDARRRAKEFVGDCMNCVSFDRVELKLQRLHPNKDPRKMVFTMPVKKND